MTTLSSGNSRTAFGGGPIRGLRKSYRAETRTAPQSRGTRWVECKRMQASVGCEFQATWIFVGNRDSFWLLTSHTSARLLLTTIRISQEQPGVEFEVLQRMLKLKRKKNADCRLEADFVIHDSTAPVRRPQLKISSWVYLVSLICFLPFSLVSTLGAQNVSVQERAANGISLARQGKLSAAERELRAAVKEAPSVAVYRAQLGSILGLEGKWQESLGAFQKSVHLAPENLDFRRELAAVQWQLNLFSDAQSNLLYVLKKRPSDPGAILLLGLVKEKLGDYAKAAQLLDSQFKLVAVEPERTVSLFHSVVESGQHDKIAKVVDVLKLHANDKPWADAIIRCTQIAMLGGDLQTAEVLFSLIPAENSVRVAAGFQLAKLFYSHSQVSRAEELLLKLKSQGVDNADIEVLLGNCFESEHQSEQAIAAYRRAIAADPSRVERYEDLIFLFLYQHRIEDALLVVNQALAIAPNDSRPWVWKGNVDLRRNAYNDAVESYTHALRLDKENSDALYGVAAAYYATGQSDAAIAQCKAGISQFPDDARFYLSYADILLASPDAMQQHAQARNLLDKALKFAPHSAQAHYLLGQIALQEGQLKEAEEYLLRSLSFDSERSKTHFALSRVYRRTGRADEAEKEFALYEKLKEKEESGGSSLGTSTTQ